MSQEPMMEVTSDDKLWAALAYVFTPLIPIVLMLLEDKKNRPFIKAHNMQALVWGVVFYIIVSFAIILTLKTGKEKAHAATPKGMPVVAGVE